jgi:hypothetical protein
MTVADSGTRYVLNIVVAIDITTGRIGVAWKGARGAHRIPAGINTTQLSHEGKVEIEGRVLQLVEQLVEESRVRL